MSHSGTRGQRPGTQKTSVNYQGQKGMHGSSHLPRQTPQHLLAEGEMENETRQNAQVNQPQIAIYLSNLGTVTECRVAVITAPTSVWVDKLICPGFGK